MGNTGAVVLEQNEGMGAKVVVTKGFTVIVIGITLAHCPVFGVNV